MDGNFQPERAKVQTSTLKSGIAFGFSSLGAIPVRYGSPRFPVLRRRFSNDNQEAKLLVDGVSPDIFGLGSFTSVGKAVTAPLGNQSALRRGVNLGKNNGNLIRVAGSYMEVQCMANIYANSLDLLLDWIASAVDRPTIRGKSEFADGCSVPVNVEISTSAMSWTDPVELNDASTFTERLFNVSVDFRVNILAAHVTTIGLPKNLVIETNVDGEALEDVIELPAGDHGDW